MTAITEPTTPGCFGAASVHSIDSEVCQACVATAACAQAATRNLQAIRALLDGCDLLQHHAAARSAPPPRPRSLRRSSAQARVAVAVCAADQEVLDRIGCKSVKAMAQAAVLCRTGKLDEMRAMLPRRCNPFAHSGPRFLRVACDMLLNGGYTKASFKAQLMETLGWTDGTAGSHVAITCAVLTGFSIAVPNAGGTFVLERAYAVGSK